MLHGVESVSVDPTKAAKPCPSLVSRDVSAGFLVHDPLCGPKFRPNCRNIISHLYIDTISACKAGKVSLPEIVPVLVIRHNTREEEQTTARPRGRGKPGQP